MKQLILSLLIDDLGVSLDNFNKLLSILAEEEGEDYVAELKQRAEQFPVYGLERIRIKE